MMPKLKLRRAAGSGSRGGRKINPAFGRALRKAWHDYQARHEEITQARVGLLVAQAVGREKPYSSQIVSNWFKGQEPGFTEGIALARVLDVDPRELAVREPAVTGALHGQAAPAKRKRGDG